MGKRNDKLGRAAHIKRHTVGTSNEISFSVLDAAKNELEGDVGKDAAARPSRFGHVSLFTLPLRRKKSIATPTKERGLLLSSGEFASAENPTPVSALGTVDVGSPKSDVGGPTTVPTGAPRKTAAAGSAAPAAGAPAPVPSKLVRSPEEEIALRKARRRLHRMLAATFVVVVGLCLAGAGGWYLYQDHQRHLHQVAQLDEALDLIREADETVVALDGIVANPLDAGSLAQADSVLAKLPAALAQLEEADAAARRVSVDLRESEDKEAANQTVAATGARTALIESGRQIVEQAQRADEAARAVREAWQRVVEADALARDAAALVADTTAEHVTASKDKTNAAVVAFADAQTALEALDSAYADVDLASPLDYVAKRIEAMGYALASDDAFLAKNKEEAVAQNDAYNRADAEAATLAAGLPDDVAQLVFDAYDQATGTLFETYSTARSQAGAADAFLRDYLGTTSK
ncbi:hypothetical protein [Gordonibacter urolithinfaciens]|uniref:Uncharacterized protein n=1 Tax=Gordonibacter urolithinfaciens TaxID=1335613 RepID=A0A6N8IH18_9ACTN|nr:hypothetical protein [Gordonibacter urolithinfaciens]MVM54109.1 hypothetical protein [Gordonibacter urolithinfaciens]MVN15107.1 hypothetical protein [Gordonibacter urolithinfaciens]MVN40035.1 hypothetical protein [Gordonibacter urolithinfaciens]MVN55975.1 hypothetical protein [Gordonibacter urolithinfaciens]MVN62376.1 hypothetical protein [Gordonibacter urolithinfaciens]